MAAAKTRLHQATVAEVEANVTALKELMDERDRSYIERFTSSERNVVTAMSAAEKAVATAMTAAEKAVATAMAAAEKAVTKAEFAAEKRFDAVNEFRQTLADQQATFARSDTVVSSLDRITQTSDFRFSSIEKQLEDIKNDLVSFISGSSGHTKGIAQFSGWIFGIVMLLLNAISIWLHRN